MLSDEGDEEETSNAVPDELICPPAPNTVRLGKVICLGKQGCWG